jgi:hypothetical protein
VPAASRLGGCIKRSGSFSFFLVWFAITNIMIEEEFSVSVRNIFSREDGREDKKNINNNRYIREDPAK